MSNWRQFIIIKKSQSFFQTMAEKAKNFQLDFMEEIGLKWPVVCKPKYSMTALGSRAALDCGTGQSKGRFTRSINPIRCLCLISWNLSFKMSA